MFVRSFISLRRTSLLLPGGESTVFKIGAGVPQGSPLSVVLFVFYNSRLFNLYRRLRVRISNIEYIDNLKALYYSTSTKRNYWKLKELY